MRLLPRLNVLPLLGRRPKQSRPELAVPASRVPWVQEMLFILGGLVAFVGDEERVTQLLQMLPKYVAGTLQ